MAINYIANSSSKRSGESQKVQIREKGIQYHLNGDGQNRLGKKHVTHKSTNKSNQIIIIQDGSETWETCGFTETDYNR